MDEEVKQLLGLAYDQAKSGTAGSCHGHAIRRKSKTVGHAM
jgi:hypothetical protein